MILTDVQMLEIASQLYQPSSDGRLAWRRVESGGVSATLPNHATVEIHPAAVGSRVIRLKDEFGTVLGSLTWQSGTGAVVGAFQLDELFSIASQKAAESLYGEIMGAIKATQSSSVVITSALPPRIGEVQSGEVLKKMAGRWLLDYSRGTETVDISEDGTYHVVGMKEPKYKLKVLAWNGGTNAAEVAKDYTDGDRRLQIEFLTISDQTMIGHAKHDMHRLTYRRIQPRR
jgi:hypothetical protein